VSSKCQTSSSFVIDGQHYLSSIYFFGGCFWYSKLIFICCNCILWFFYDKPVATTKFISYMSSSSVIIFSDGSVKNKMIFFFLSFAFDIFINCNDRHFLL
jgi:hypothetical protein